MIDMVQDLSQKEYGIMA